MLMNSTTDGLTRFLNALALSKVVVPSHYEVTLCLNPNNRRFRGWEVISLFVSETVTQIEIHAARLDIKSASITNEAGERVTASISYNTERQTAWLDFSSKICRGDWKLFINFAGSHEHDDHPVAAQLASARTTFPCFDEPEFKARFELKLIVDKDQTALSNAPVVSVRPISRRKKIVTFAPTQPMSTKDNCFVVGDLEASEPVIVAGKEIRIWCERGKKSLISATAMQCLVAWIEVWGVEVLAGCSKLDMVAMPKLVGWQVKPGLGAQHPLALLDLVPGENGDTDKIRCWFGDLPSMKWEDARKYLGL
jgi:puromycin-sensitive aminopeptidase